ncbi:MAG TPA: FmdB family zinc ribbon protein [Gemmatimonadaceae bacterium]|jgi:putative FmdB family regulatory protein
MPTYEYRCANGHDFEDFVLKISAAKPELPCPTCGVPAERRVSAGGGLLFKGSGFYITDYGKDGKKAAKPATAGTSKEGGDAASSAGAKSDAPKPDSAKADAKPAAAPAATPAKGGE